MALLVALLATCPCGARSQAPDAGAEPALTAPVLRDATAPALPPELASISLPAEVLVELTVTEQGSAVDAVVLSSTAPELEALALHAVQSLRFEPALRDGLPIAARIEFRFSFAPPPGVAVPPPASKDDLPVTPTASAPSGDAPPPASEPLVTDAIVLDVQGERPPREPTSHRLEARALQKMPGTNGDPLRAIETMPGVARPPGLSGDLIVRGSAPQDSAVFIDGLSVPFAYHFGGVSSVVPTEALTRLDFRPGNFGAEYGRAMGGVVDLKLASPRRDAWGGLAQVDTLDGRVLAQGPLGSHTRLLVAGRRSWVDAWLGRVVDEEEVSFRTAPAYWDAQAILEHDFGVHTTARLFYLGAEDRLAFLASSPTAQDPALGGSLSALQRFTRVGLSVSSELSDDVRITETFSWGVDRFDIVFGPSFSDVRVHLLQNRTELRTRHARWLTSAAGLDAQLSRYHVNLRVRPYGATDQVDGPYFARPLQRFDEQVWLLRPAAYALVELTPTPGMRIIPGVRADYGDDTERVTVDPRINVRADVHDSPRTTLKGGIGYYHQPPQPQESVEPFGTPQIRSNRALHGSAGIEQEIVPGVEVWAEGFAKRFRDLVIGRAAEDESELGTRFSNRGSGMAYGGELLLRCQQDDRFFGWVAYTLSRTERRNGPGEPSHVAPWDQTHVLSALGSVTLGRGYSLGARFRYVTGTPYTPVVGGVVDLDAGAYAPVQDAALYSSRLPAFMQLDLRLDKAWQVRRGKITAYLELRNATNRKNAEAVSYRYDYAESSVQSGLPILPVIGIRGER